VNAVRLALLVGVIALAIAPIDHPIRTILIVIATVGIIITIIKDNQPRRRIR
jgi:hypothetical protein